jgi:hypothetical protein
MNAGGTIAAVVGLLFGIVLAALGAFDLKKIDANKQAYVRGSLVVLGLLFIGLAIATFAGAFNSKP